MLQFVKGPKKSKRQVAVGSSVAAGWMACRSREGWNIWLSGVGAGPSRRRYFIPEAALAGRNPWWLSNRLVGEAKRALLAIEGSRRISYREACELLPWLRRIPFVKSKLNARQRARAAARRRRYRKFSRIPQTLHGGGYWAELTARGWMVQLSTRSGRCQGHFLVPLAPEVWRRNGPSFMAALRRNLGAVEGAQKVDDRRFGEPTWTRRAA